MWLPSWPDDPNCVSYFTFPKPSFTGFSPYQLLVRWWYLFYKGIPQQVVGTNQPLFLSFQIDDPEILKVRSLAVNWVDSMFRCSMNVGYWADNVPFWITKRLLPGSMHNMKKYGVEFQQFLIKKVVYFVFMFVLKEGYRFRADAI